MQGLHLTGDLFDCGCSANFLTDLGTLSKLCRGTVLLAESHLAIHTWPERRGVTLDVYVCNFTDDNSGKAQQLFDTLMVAFRPRQQVVNRIARGDLSASSVDVAATARLDAPAVKGVTQTGQIKHELIFDWLNAHSGYGYTATAQLAAMQSPYQRVEVYDTPQFGRLFRLDGRLMTSEREEFFYHECMTHPALLAHPNPQSVLVIGGGDGGSSEEIFKHPSVRRIVMAELDPVDDPRLEIKLGDGYEFVKNCNEKFDLVVLDLTDPDTPAFHLYSEEFFRLCQRVMNPGGIMTMHLGSPVFQAATVKKNAANLRKVFKQVHPMALYIPLYGSLWCLGIASDGVNPRLLSNESAAQRMRERKLSGLRYYNAELHAALFSLPTFVKELTDASPSVATKLAA
jgi:spermidine synthase